MKTNESDEIRVGRREEKVFNESEREKEVRNERKIGTPVKERGNEF